MFTLTRQTPFYFKEHCGSSGTLLAYNAQFETNLL
jgi:hypothetical protein